MRRSVIGNGMGTAYGDYVADCGSHDDMIAPEGIRTIQPPHGDLINFRTLQRGGCNVDEAAIFGTLAL